MLSECFFAFEFVLEPLWRELEWIFAGVVCPRFFDFVVEVGVRSFERFVIEPWDPFDRAYSRDGKFIPRVHVVLVFVYPRFSYAECASAQFGCLVFAGRAFVASAHYRILRFEPAAYAVLIEPEVMVVSFRSRNFLKNVSGCVSSRLVRQFSNGGKSVSPEVLKGLTNVERIALVLAIQLLITERDVKRTKMVVRAIVIVAILAAGVISDSRILEVVAESFYEILQMFFI